MKIYLASASPRRKEILSMAGVDFEIMVSDVDENISSTSAEDLVLKLSKLKALAVFDKLSGADTLVIGADTVVSVDGKVYGKPKDYEDFHQMMLDMSGKEHQVYTGVYMAYRDKGGKRDDKSFVNMTKVYVDELDDEDIRAYWESGEPVDKAGGYAIQGRFAKHIKAIVGDYYNVVGLPVNEICRELKWLQKS
jgi:septum formation protein